MTIRKDNHDLLNSLPPEKRAQVLKALKEEALRARKPPITRRPREAGHIPLSLAQNRLWRLSQLRPDSPAYNEVCVLRLEGTLDAALLERCLGEIVRRHEALRTTFHTVDDAPVQVISPTGTLPLRRVDLTAAPEQEAELERLTAEEARRPFDLGQGPLLRTTLFQLGAERAVLMVTAHHLVLDGWSIGVIQRELAELYEAAREGRPSPLAELPIQYADYTLWQRQWLRGETQREQLDYWLRQLSGLPPLLRLPFSRTRPETEGFAGATEPIALEDGLREGLLALGRRTNTSLFMTLLAAFQTLLHRYTQRTDLPVGTVVANRDPPETEPLIGFFVNTLVLRGALGGDPTFTELLGRVRDTALGAFEHQQVPFEQVVDALQPERSLSYNPLFQVMFILQNTPAHALALPGLTLSPTALGTVTAKYDLTLSLEETPRGLQGQWEYNRDLFDAGTVRRMTGHLETLLRAVLEDPERPVSTLPLLPESERRLLQTWNQTEADFPRTRCLHALIEEQVERTPDALALEQGPARTSYRELNTRANQLAHRLRTLGVGPGRLVGVCLPRSPDMVVSLLAVMKAGGAYVPLDPAYPRQRLADMLADANVAVLITHEALCTRLPAGTAKVLCLDTEAEALAREPRDNPPATARAEDLAYVIYTSGSTGAPKGVCVSHRNLVHSTTARWAAYPEPLTRFLLLSSFSFDSSVAGLYWTLTRGGTLELPEGEGLPEPALLRERIASQGISHLLCIPSVYALILRGAQAGQLASLRVVIVAGEACPPGLIAEHRARAPEATLYNEYGPTEATVWCTVQALREEPLGGRVPIGRPIANTRIHLLDVHQQPVPIGVPGELYVGGEGVAQGYLHAPALTEARFLPDPFSEQPGARLYRTGDLARHLPDGVMEFLGRLDHQVKLRGYRIETGEIEALLRRHAGVQEAVVLVRDEGTEQARLAAFVATEGARGVSSTALRERATGALPGFAVPSEFVCIEHLPRLPNGKVDRHALLSLHEPRERPPEDSGQWTDLQRLIASIWEEVIHVKGVGLDDNFFKVGGDSLSVVRVFNRLRDGVNRDLSITHLFKNPTIRTLSAFLEN